MLTAVLCVAPATFAETPKAREAVCAVCGPRDGSPPEEVLATATLRGKTYAFCAVECKVEFLRNPDEFLDLGEGKPAPDFALRDLQGRPLALRDFENKVVLLDFWSTLCKPCVAALPKLQAWHEKYAAQGFSVVGLSTDSKVEALRKSAKKSGVAYPVAQATPEVWRAYKISVLPALVLVGRDGKMLRRFGEKTPPETIAAAIEAALRDKADNKADKGAAK